MLIRALVALLTCLGVYVLMLIVDVHFVEGNIARKKPLPFAMACDGHGYGRVEAKRIAVPLHLRCLTWGQKFGALVVW